MKVNNITQHRKFGASWSETLKITAEKLTKNNPEIMQKIKNIHPTGIISEKNNWYILKMENKEHFLQPKLYDHHRKRFFCLDVKMVEKIHNALKGIGEEL